MYSEHNIYFYAVPRTEFAELGVKYPTGEYYDGENNKWFKLGISCNGFPSVKITWFLGDIQENE